MNEEITTEVIVDEEEQNIEETQNGSVLGTILKFGIGAGVLGGIGYLIHRRRAKREERYAKELEKKGWKCEKPVSDDTLEMMEPEDN